MNFFDHPVLSGTSRPKFLDCEVVLPGFYIVPESPGVYEVHVYLASSDNAFSCKSKTFKEEELSSFLQRYVADPESVLKEEFQWLPVKQKPKQRETLTLADLGL